MKVTQTFEELRQDAVAWANGNFPQATTRSKAEHLRREVAELVETPSDGEEMADVLLLLLHLADGEGIDVITEAAKKLAKNKRRVWGKPDASGVVEHVRGQV
jgi:NTP pyrophosphatase (non-canonical NTP hydrolase)